MKCFSFKQMNFKYGIFDNSIDCTYIIHLEGNQKRLNNIKNQLSKYKPTKKLYIYLNKGFKNCKKNLVQQKSNYDIIDSFLNIFTHANENNFNNILVLEDDFIFKRVILQDDLTNINNFCNKNKQDKFMLSLGLLNVLYFPINRYFNKCMLAAGAHAIIYSKKMRENLLANKKYINYSTDWDIYQTIIFNKYFYYKPLVYQKFEKTENQYNWPLLFGIKYLGVKYIKFLNFEKNPEKAFDTHYKIAFVVNLVFYLCIIIVIYILIRIYLDNKIFNKI